MNIQEKVLQASNELRARAGALAASALAAARDRARLISVLAGTRREFGKVARRHVSQLVKQNSTIASAARKDVADLARATYASLSQRTVVKKARRAAPVARRRSAKAA
jgi:hypothetical protein